MSRSPYTPKARGGGAARSFRGGDLSAHRSTPRRSPSFAGGISNAGSHFGTPGPYGRSHLRQTLSARTESPSVMSEGSDDYGTVVGGAGVPLSGTIRKGTILVKDDKSRVVAVGELPTEVKQELEHTDLYRHHVRASVDPVSGYAVVSSLGATYVWNYLKQSSSTSTTTYIFPSPFLPSNFHPEMSPLPPTPHATLISHSNSNREPSLLLVDPESGRLVFWEAVSAALTFPRFNNGGSQFGGSQFGGSVSGMGTAMGGARPIEAVMELSGGEVVMDIRVISPTTTLLTTSLSKIHRLTISSHSGHPHLHLSRFRFPASFFRSGEDRLFAASSSSFIFEEEEEQKGIRGLTIVEDVTAGGKECWVLGRERVQRWRYDGEGQDFIEEFPLKELLADEILTDAQREAHVGETLRLIDLTSQRDGTLVALVSYDASLSSESRSQAQASSPGGGLLSWTVVGFKRKDIGLHIFVPCGIQYRAHFDPRPIDAPRLVIPSGGDLAFVVFADAVISTSLNSDHPWEQVNTLRNPSENAFLGLGIVPLAEYPSIVINGSKSRSDISTRLVTLTSRSGLLSFEVSAAVLGNKEAAPAGGLSKTKAHNAMLRARIEKAVFYGGNKQNPLSFELHAGYWGSLETAVEEVSRAIVSCTSTYSVPTSDTQASLNERADLLLTLISWINENGLAHDLSQSSLRRLCGHLELIAAAKELWAYQDGENRVRNPGGRIPQTIFADALQDVMKAKGLPLTDDPVREFFKFHLLGLTDVLHSVAAILKSKAVTSQPTTTITEWQLEGNEIFEVTYTTAVDTRENNQSKYSIIKKDTAVTELWLCDSKTIASLDQVYSTSIDLLQARLSAVGTIVGSLPPDSLGSEEQLKHLKLTDQAVKLAGHLCFAFEEQIRFMAHQLENNVSDHPEKKLATQKQYTAKMKKAIWSLKDLAFDRALELAEHHHQWDLLAQLSTGSGGSPELVDQYMQSLEGDYALALFQHYADTENYQTLINQPERYWSYLSAFFSSGQYSQIAWMHSVAVGSYQQASDELEEVANSERRFAQKQLILSIAKLSAMAGKDFDDEAMEGVTGTRSQVDRVDDGLTLLKQNKRLRDLIRGTAPAHQQLAQPTQTLVENFLAGNCKRIAHQHRPGMYQLYGTLASDLLSGSALGTEDVIDLLTLKDSSGGAAGDFFEAFKLFICDQAIPEKRKQITLAAIWRRIYLADDWPRLSQTANFSDAQLRQALSDTAAYQVINALPALKDLPRSYYLGPSEALGTTDIESVRGRFGNEFDVRGLVQDDEDDTKQLLEWAKTTRLPEHVDAMLRGI